MKIPVKWHGDGALPVLVYSSQKPSTEDGYFVVFWFYVVPPTWAGGRGRVVVITHRPSSKPLQFVKHFVKDRVPKAKPSASRLKYQSNRRGADDRGHGDESSPHGSHAAHDSHASAQVRALHHMLTDKLQCPPRSFYYDSNPIRNPSTE